MPRSTISETTVSKPLGSFVDFTELSAVEQAVVTLAWQGAARSAAHGLCFQSNFPVGAGILASNPKTGERKMFCGSNVENKFFSATICAERNAATTAAMEGYTKFEVVSVFCRNYPGGSPCGLCRQVLLQFGADAVLLNVVDMESNVRRSRVSDLLPGTQAPVSSSLQVGGWHSDLQAIPYILGLRARSYVPYSKRPRAALFSAVNKSGELRVFEGVSDDNASYGASAIAESVAMRSARTAGFTMSPVLIATVDDPRAPNPVEGECLQILREFGPNPPIILVSPQMKVVETCLEELLPDSFGPDAL